jgi:hypothetical protein
MKQYTFVQKPGTSRIRLELARADGEKVLVSAGGPAVFLTDSEVGIVRHRGLIAREVPGPVVAPVDEVVEAPPAEVPPTPPVTDEDAVPDISPPRRRRRRSEG